MQSPAFCDEGKTLYSHRAITPYSYSLIIADVWHMWSRLARITLLLTERAALRQVGKIDCATGQFMQSTACTYTGKSNVFWLSEWSKTVVVRRKISSSICGTKKKQIYNDFLWYGHLFTNILKFVFSFLSVSKKLQI